MFTYFCIFCFIITIDRYSIIIICYHDIVYNIYCKHYTYIHTYRQTDRQTDRHTDIQTYRHTDIQTYRHTYLHTYILTYILTYLHTYILTYLHTYIHTYIHTYLLIICIHIHIHTLTTSPNLVTSCHFFVLPRIFHFSLYYICLEFCFSSVGISDFSALVHLVFCLVVFSMRCLICETKRSCFCEASHQTEPLVLKVLNILMQHLQFQGWNQCVFVVWLASLFSL